MKRIVLTFTLAFILLTIVSAQKSGIGVWKTITLGAVDKPTLIKKLKQMNILPLQEYEWSNFTDSIKIGSKRTVKLALVSLKDLGYDKGRGYINYYKVCAAAKKKGLQLCPREVLLQFPLQCSLADKASMGNAVIAVEPIKRQYPKCQAYYFAYIFYPGFEKVLGEVYLNGGFGYGGDETDDFDSCKFIFVVP